jgi:hypothetical protein
LRVLVYLHFLLISKAKVGSTSPRLYLYVLHSILMGHLSESPSVCETCRFLRFSF